MKNCFLIVNCNDYKSTKHLVDNIINYKRIDKILIVDNDSVKLEKDLLSKLENDKVEIYFNDVNNGYSSAINTGTRYLIEKYGKCNFIISNSDVVIFSEEDINRLLDALDNDTVGLVGPQVMENGMITRGFKNPTPLQDALFNIGIIRKLFRDRTLFYNNSLYESEFTSVDVLNGCFFLVNSEILEKVNFMDEKLFLYYEDCVLCKKVRDIGKINIIVNDVKIKHFRSVSVNKIYKALDRLVFFYESQLYFHTTYNNTNAFEIMFLGVTQSVSLFFKELGRFIKKL